MGRAPEPAGPGADPERGEGGGRRPRPYGNGTVRQPLRIGHVNARSLLPSIDDVTLTLGAQSLDLLGVSETWLSPSVDDSFLIFPGYKVVRRDRGGDRRGGGVCVLYRESLRVEVLTVPSTGSPLESLWLSLCSTTTVVIGIMYRPPSAPVTAVLDDLQSQLAHVCGTDKPLYVLGDVNFDWLRLAELDVRRYSQVLEDVNVKQLVSVPTRPASGTALDHVIVRASDAVTTATVVPCSWSDHDIVIAETPLTKERRRPAEITVRSPRSLVPDSLCLELLLSAWDAVYSAAEPAAKWQAWLAVWTPVLDRHMPVVTIRPRHPPCPWLTDNEEVRALMRERNLARAAQRDNPTPETTGDYRRCRNGVKQAIGRAKANFFVSSYRYARKTTWKDIRRFLIAPKGGLTTTDAAGVEAGWADRLNEYFASVGPRVAAELEATQRDSEPLPPRPPRVVAGAYRVRPATLPELSAALGRMSSSKACGEDGVTIGMLRMTWSVIAPHVLEVVNASLVSGVLPGEWKRATVVPIHKSGSTSEPNNYRPVSILPVVAKLVESVVSSQLLEYLIAHSVLTDVQHGFRPGRSTESAMLDTVGYLMDGMDKGYIGCLTTADTSKAFDSVQHSRLLEKLAWYGIQDHWFSNWLENRFQRTRGGETLLEITHGVIQGSLIGPILFLIFTNDLPSYLEDSKIVMYADDVQFLHQGQPRHILDLQQRVEHTVNTAHRWFNANSLKINPTKTDLVLIKSKRRQLNHNFTINFGNAEIPLSQAVKVLGMTLDSNLSFDAQVSTVIRRCYATMGGLAKLARSLPEEVKKMIIESLVFPHLVYCMSVWAGCGTTQRQRIQKVINHCAQIVKGVPRSAHVSAILSELGWPNVDVLVAERDMAMMHSILHNDQAPASLRERVVYRDTVSVRDTRATDAGQLQLPRVRTEHARKFFNSRAAAQWNSAPAEIREASTAAKCRRMARDHFTRTD